MTPSAYQKAQSERRKLVERLDKLDKFIKLHQDLYPDEAGDPDYNLKVDIMSSSLDTNENSTEHSENDPSMIEIISATRRIAAGQNTKPQAVIRMAKRIIQRQGHPMTRTELLRALRRQGVVINGKDPAKVLGTTMWRAKEIENIEGEGYWVKGLPRVPVS